MDSIFVIFVFALISILECHAEISWQERLNLLMADVSGNAWRGRPRTYSDLDNIDDVLQKRQQYRRAMDKSKYPTIFNKNIYNLPMILKDISENPSRRNLVSAEEPEEYVSRKSLYNQDHPKNIYKINRRLYDFHAGMRSPIIGAPSMSSHLPEAEPILPGHTLLRPALGMLKSAVKFPHKDLGDASGVYGNLNNLGITYSGTGERVLYTGFRRRNDDNNEEVTNDSPRLLVAILHKRRDYEDKPIARYIDYGKREREKKIKQEEEQRLKEKERLRQLAPDSAPYENYLNDAKMRDVKRLLKTLTANGVTLEFFEIPRLKLEALQKENYHESIKPYTEFLEATRMKDFETVEQRFPSIAKQYARNSFIPQKYRHYGGYRQGGAGGIKKYARR